MAVFSGFYEALLDLLHGCCPGGRRGNTEPVVTRWRRPVASGVAMVMLHWAMPDATCIASTPHHDGHRNGPQLRGICSPLPPISLDIIVANDHVMVH